MEAPFPPDYRKLVYEEVLKVVVLHGFDIGLGICAYIRRSPAFQHWVPYPKAFDVQLAPLFPEYEQEMKDRGLNPGQYFFSRSRTWEEKKPHDELRIAILRKWIAQTERLITSKTSSNENDESTPHIYPQMPADCTTGNAGSPAGQGAAGDDDYEPEPNEPEHNYPQ